MGPAFFVPGGSHLAPNADQRRDDEIRELNGSIEQIRSGRIKVATGRDVLIARLEHRITDLERMRQRGTGNAAAPAELALAFGSAYFAAVTWY